MPENRLDIVLSAKLDNLRQGFRAAEQDARKSSLKIGEAIEAAGDGAAGVVKAIESIDDAFASSAEEGADALERLGDASSDSGRELREAFVRGGKSVEEAEKEVKGLVDEIRKLAKARDDVQSLKGEFRDLSKTLDGAQEEVQEVQKELDGINLQNALQGVKEFADKITDVAGSFSEVADKQRELRRDIKLAFDDPKEAERYIGVLDKLQDKYGDLVKDTESFGKSVKRLDALQAAAPDNIERLAKVALDAGKDFDDAADDLGEFFADIDSGNADFAILGETLRSNFGIAGEALRDYGAEVDLNGKLIAKTREQQLKAQEALKRYIDESERYSNIATRNKDAQAKLGDEFAKFQRGVGENIDAFKELVAEALLPALEALNNMPPGFKAAVAGAALLAPAVAGTAVAGLNAVAVYTGLTGKTVTLAAVQTKAAAATTALSGSLATARAGAAAFAGSVGGIITVVAAAAVALYSIKKASDGYVESIEQVDKAHTALLQTEAEAVRRDKELLTIRRKSISDLKSQAAEEESLAKRRVVASKAVLSAQLELREIERSGGDTTVAKKRLDDARQFRKEVDTLKAKEVAREKDVASATRARFKEAQEAYLQFKDEYDNGVFDSEKKALASLEALASGLDGAPAKQAEKDMRALRGKILAIELESLKKRIEAEETTAEESKAILSGLLSTYRANADARRKAETEIDEANKQLLEKRAQRLERILQQEVQLEKEAVAQKRKAAEDEGEIKSLERRLDKGEDVISLIKSEVNERQRNLEKILEEEAAVKRLAIENEKAANIRRDPSNEDKIRANAAKAEANVNRDLEIQREKLRVQSEERLQSLREKQAKKLASLEASRAKVALESFEQERLAAERVFEERRKALDLEESRGGDVGQKRIDLEIELREFQRQSGKERLELARQEIEERRKSANVGASESQQKLNDERAQLETLKAQAQVKESLKSIDDAAVKAANDKLNALLEQKRILEEQTKELQKQQGFSLDSSFGGLNSVEDAFSQNTSNLGVSAFGEGSDGKSLEEINREIKRQRIKVIEANEKAGVKTSTGGKNGSDLTKAVNTSERASNDALNAAANLTADMLKSSEFLDSASVTNQLLSQLVNEVRIGNKAQVSSRSSTPPPDNFADRNLTKRSESTLL